MHVKLVPKLKLIPSLDKIGFYLSRSLIPYLLLQVTSTYPLRAIGTAMNRIPPGWDTAWIPSERLSLNDALIA